MTFKSTILGNQLFYSPETRIKIEQELSKLINEPNPFRNGHFSKWGQVKDKPETIGEMMQRWNGTLENSKLVKNLFDINQQEFLRITLNKNISQKKVIIDEQIHIHSKCKLGDDELSSITEIGYKNKGYRWFESGNDFSLKDFITYHPETISDQVYYKQIITSFHNSRSSQSIETLAEQAPLNELNFLYACEGYATAKYVDFLKNEFGKTTNKKNPSNKIKGRSAALFCSIINQSGIIAKGMDNNTDYCKKVLSKFKINAPVKTRQYFSESMDLKKSDKYFTDVIENILPGIDDKERKKIQGYIDSKKLYN